MAQSVENRANLMGESIFFLPALTNEVFKKNQVLKKRRELLEEIAPREKLKNPQLRIIQ